MACGGTEQQWRLLGGTGGVWTLQNVKSGQLLDMSGQGTANGSALDIWPDNGGSNERWRF
uniref:RICIN domain-containing protein n=1 Tax=Niveibacterium sp. SC-1 TaxID=3135646 RepID=UPI0040544C09